MTGALTAGLWGLVGGSALVLGAAVAWFVRLPQRLIAAVMAIGSGVLISAVAFDLMDEAYHRGGFAATALGFVGGAVVYTAANVLLSRRGARHRKRSGHAPMHDSLTHPRPPAAAVWRSPLAHCSTGFRNRS